MVQLWLIIRKDLARVTWKDSKSPPKEHKAATCPFSTTVFYSSKLSVSLAEKMDATLVVTTKGMWGWKMKKKTITQN